MSESTALPKEFKRAFKEADIRGIYPTEINAEVAYRVARAFVEEFKYKEIVVGYDMRLSTPELKRAFINGARESGAAVIDIGMVRSPMLYFASGHLNLPGAVITASHSPKEYNGIKLVAPQAVPLTSRTGLAAIKRRVAEGKFRDARTKGMLKKRSLQREYRSYILHNIDRTQFAGQYIVADIGNGMAGATMVAFDRAVPADFTLLFQEPDGSFPNRDSDPCLSKNQRALKRVITETNADFGIGFDGDGDRIAFLDENGKYVNCAAIGALIAARLLEEKPGAGIVYTNLTSRILKDVIEEGGGKAIRARVGHTFLKKELRKSGAIFGAEHSGHFFWKKFFDTDSTILTLLAIMEAYSQAKKEGKTFSQMLKPYTIYSQTEDVIVHVEDKEEALAAMKKELTKSKPKELIEFDGFFVDYGDVWGAVKPSVTEFAIKLMFESKSKKQATALQQTLLTKLEAIAAAQKTSGGDTPR